MYAFLKQSFYNPVCLKCGSFFVNDSLFCYYCERKYLKKKLVIQKHTIGEKDKHLYLIEWVPDESDVISHMVYQMKSNKCIFAWRYYARQFAQQSLEGYEVIVPLPGSKPSSVHSKIFAKFLSEEMKIPVLDCLIQDSATEVLEQKQQTKKQRLAPKKDLLVKGDFVQFTKILFVDDILTTGQTFKRSKKALKQKGESMILTLFYRQCLSQS